MKTSQPMPRNQVIAMAIFALLALLIAFLWFKDPSHQTNGKSRIPWPPASPAKP